MSTIWEQAINLKNLWLKEEKNFIPPYSCKLLYIRFQQNTWSKIELLNYLNSFCDNNIDTIDFYNHENCRGGYGFAILHMKSHESAKKFFETNILKLYSPIGTLQFENNKSIIIEWLDPFYIYNFFDYHQQHTRNIISELKYKNEYLMKRIYDLEKIISLHDKNIKFQSLEDDLDENGSIISVIPDINSESELSELNKNFERQKKTKNISPQSCFSNNLG